MQIDIYFIFLFQLATVLFVYQVAIVINRVKDNDVKKELKIIRSQYDGLMGLGDIIVWPVILTILFPLYAILRLLFKRKILRLLKIIITDGQLLKLITLVLTIFLLLVVFALWHYFIAYAVVFLSSVVNLIFCYKKEKSLYES